MLQNFFRNWIVLFDFNCFDRMFKIKSLGGKVNHKVGMDKREPYGSSDEEEFEVSTHNLLQHQ